MGDLNGPIYRSAPFPYSHATGELAAPPPVPAKPTHTRSASTASMADPLEYAEHENVLPWDLRLLATYLQHYPASPNLTSAYYDLASYARHQYGLAAMGRWEEEKLAWKTRLRDLGVRVANALVEMGDWEGAKRHLQSLRVGLGDGLDAREEDELLRGRIALICARVGDLKEARELLGLKGKEQGREEKRIEGPGAGEDDASDDHGREEKEAEEDAPTGPYAETLLPLLSLARGDYGAAHSQLQTGLLPQPLARHNQAVTALYQGRLSEARDLLEDLVNQADTVGAAGSAQLLNLAMVYELATDRGRALKMALAEKVAGREGDGKSGWERGMADFKL